MRLIASGRASEIYNVILSGGGPVVQGRADEFSSGRVGIVAGRARIGIHFFAR